MVITREGLLDFWRDVDQGRRAYGAPPYGCWDLNGMPFPDLGRMTPKEKREFKKRIARHPEWLLSKIIVFAEHGPNGPMIQ